MLKTKNKKTEGKKKVIMLVRKKDVLCCLTAIVLIFSNITTKAQQGLPPTLFSQNGWIQDTVGGNNNSGSYPDCPGLYSGFSPNYIPCRVSTTNNINKNNLWNNVKNSQARLIRYGGTTADQNKPELWQYLKFVDSVRAKGMEPILQISLNYGGDGTAVYDTSKAKIIIDYINNIKGRNVVYWSIGNEPDNKLPQGYGYDTTTKVFLITTYIKNFSKAMRRAVPSVPIKIIGPELAQWNCAAGSSKKNMVDSLLTPGQRCDITGKDSNNKPWIDVFSFHFYGGIDGDAASLPRATLIDKLRKTNGLAQTLDTLNVKLAAANTAHSRTGSAALISAITEANIDFQTISTDAFSDVKCNGFLAGQYWLEIASIAAEKGVSFVNFWSAAESSMGYMKSDGTKKSTYYHFKKAAENLSGTYFTASDDSVGVAIKTIKAFGTIDANHIVIFIMNQDLLTGTPTKRYYGINFNNTYTGITAVNKIKINMGVDTMYQDTIEASSTVMLEFDVNGNISQKFTYKQSLNNSPAGFQQPYCGTSVTYTTQGQLNGYVPGVYQNITITPPVGGITIGPTNNSIYKAVNSITINGPFTVPLGQPFELSTSACP